MSIRFDEAFLSSHLSDVELIHTAFPADIFFSVDSRTLQKGALFVALPGNTTDGHSFLKEAFERGAAGCIIGQDKKASLSSIDKKLLGNSLVIAVPDVMQAFHSLASAWRAQFSYPVVAITGSVGKTTTKQMVGNILALHGTDHLLSYGNQNTKIGLMLNIMRMREHHKAAIFELGISERGEMEQLVSLLRPTSAVITGIGHSHMQGLGSLADIAFEKRAIFTFFGEDSIGIVNGDQAELANIGYAHPVIKFGTKTTNQIQARKVQVSSDHISFTLKIYKQKFHIVLKRSHTGSVMNALAAVAVTHLLHVPTDVIVKGVQLQTSVAGRFEYRSLPQEKGIMIDDTYNANPESMKAALLALEHIKTPAQKIAVLGDMLELGVNSPFWHRQLGRFLRKVPSLRQVILVGNMVKWTEKTVPVGVAVEIVPTWQEAIEKLQPKLQEPSCVLVKGSRGVHLEHVVDHFAKKDTY